MAVPVWTFEKQDEYNVAEVTVFTPTVIIEFDFFLTEN